MSATAILKLQQAGFTTQQVEALASFMDDQSASKTDLDHAVYRRDMELMKREIVNRLGGMMIIGVTIILAAIRYLPAH